MDEAELQPWITDATGRSVRALQRVAYGASRATYLVEMEAGGDLVARVDTGDGPMAGTELSLVREAAVYRALAGTGVRIPRLHAVAPDGTVLLTDRAPGTHEVNALPSAERHVVYDDYLDAIADLHDVDAMALDLPGHRRPSDGPSHARNELDLWAGILDARTRRPWPLARYTLAVLRELAPAVVDRTVLCHGDVGPGNFLHEGGRVTALLDWEFAHLGDPMDDLAWWVFRGHDMRGDCGDLGAQLARWSARTGIPVDLGRSRTTGWWSCCAGWSRSSRPWSVAASGWTGRSTTVSCPCSRSGCPERWPDCSASSCRRCRTVRTTRRDRPPT